MVVLHFVTLKCKNQKVEIMVALSLSSNMNSALWNRFKVILDVPLLPSNSLLIRQEIIFFSERVSGGEFFTTENDFESSNLLF